MRPGQVDFKQRLVKLPTKRIEKDKWRFVLFNAVALAALKQLRERQPQSPWVFVNRKGEKLRSRRDWFDPAVEASGIEDDTWHCNRHAFASRLVMAGVDARTVAQLMGHRTIQMTMRYAHPAPDHRQSACDKRQASGFPAAAKCRQNCHHI